MHRSPGKWAWLQGWLLLGALAAVDGWAAEPRLLDRSVASVNGQVLTWSELDFEARVLLVYAGGTQAATQPLDMAVLKDSLEEIITQRLLAGEAEKLGAYPLDEGELDAAVRRFKGRFSTQGDWLAFLGRHETDESGVASALQRFLRAQRLLDGRLRLKAQVSEAEARRYIDEHSEVVGLPTATVRQKIFADKFRTLALNEVRATRKAARVRLLGPFATGAVDAGAP